jgi:hypothetical protein
MAVGDGPWLAGALIEAALAIAIANASRAN